MLSAALNLVLRLSSNTDPIGIQALALGAHHVQVHAVDAILRESEIGRINAIKPDCDLLFLFLLPQVLTMVHEALG